RASGDRGLHGRRLQQRRELQRVVRAACRSRTARLSARSEASRRGAVVIARIAGARLPRAADGGACASGVPRECGVRNFREALSAARRQSRGLARTGERMKIALNSIMVDDQSKALAFYTDVLGFVKQHDIPLGEFRWITVVSPEAPECAALSLEPNAN